MFVLLDGSGVDIGIATLHPFHPGESQRRRKMEERPKTFIMPIAILRQLSMLDSETCRKFCEIIADYQDGNDPDLSSLSKSEHVYFLNISEEFNRLRKIRNRNAENGQKGGRPVTQNNPDKPKITQNNPREPKLSERKANEMKLNEMKLNEVKEEEKEKGITPTLQKTIEEPRVSVNDDAKIILEYLNEKAGKKFAPVESNTRYILARLKEKGVTVDKCKEIIDDRVFEWKGKVNGNFEGDKYLTPQTIFCKTNFWKYEGMLMDIEKKPNYYMRKQSLTENFGF